MRDPNRIPQVLAAVGAYWQKHPDLRLGQIVSNMAAHDPFYLEDDDLMVALSEADEPRGLPLHRTEAGYPNCSTCDGGGCYDCTDPA